MFNLNSEGAQSLRLPLNRWCTLQINMHDNYISYFPCRALYDLGGMFFLIFSSFSFFGVLEYTELHEVNTL